jgi:hypothetical protein
MVVASEVSAATIEKARAQIASLEVELAAEREARRQAEGERDRLRVAYRQPQVEVELLRRKIFAAKAERIDTAQLELEFAEKCRELDALAGQLGARAGDDDGPPPKERRRARPHGRRNLKDHPTLPEVRVEVPDLEMERLVAEGRAERFGFDVESSEVKHRRGGRIRLVLARIKYRLGKLEGAQGATVDADETASAIVPNEVMMDDKDNAPQAGGTPNATPSSPSTGATKSGIDRSAGTTIVTAKMPPRILGRSIGAPSLYANLIHEKLGRGMPFYRQEAELAAEGIPIDRGTMCRWCKKLGVIMGKTVVAAMREDAKATAFCIATDATGVLVQPLPDPDGKRQACKRGHFFVMIADRDHVLFEYTPDETSKAVFDMFRGFGGYVQADAKSVYDILFRDLEAEPPDKEIEPDGESRTEVGCWSHARRKFYEAAITTKEVAAREALLRVHRLFDYEERWRGLPPDRRKELRDRMSRPELESFFNWAEPEYRKVEHERGLLRSAFVYVRRQRDALMRYLDDGRLEIDNNASEREMKRVAIGRKNWLFIGSDDHGQPTANLLSLIASARLHRLDPWEYLRDVFNLLPQWPEDRYLELTPKYWRQTHPRLDQAQLENEVAWFTIPPPLPQPPVPVLGR